MCFERFSQLRCGHFESLKLETASCYYAVKSKQYNSRTCPDYRQAVTREDKGRSCPRCKANMLAGLGVSSFSLGSGRPVHAPAVKAAAGHAHAHAHVKLAPVAKMAVVGR